MFWTYYVICVFYCFYQVVKRYRKGYNEGMVGHTPGLDTIMIVVLAWILAPVDFSLTWIRWYKEAEEVRRDRNKII